MKRLNEFIDSYKDFPKKGIDFKDVLGITQEPEVFKELILRMSTSQIIKNAEAIISVDARGFIFGSAISLQASKPMIVARKPGKLPENSLKKIIVWNMEKLAICSKKSITKVQLLCNS